MLGAALAALFLLICFWIFDAVSRANQALESRIIDQKSELSQMQLLSSEQNQVSENVVLAQMLETLASKTLREETEGLNSALFQQHIRQTLQECGMERVSIAISVSEDPELPGLSVYEAAVRARDADGVFALCYQRLSEMEVAAKIDYIRWTNSGLFQVNVLGFSEL
ncbi:MAG: hypothetical protein ACE37M_13015 [Henriciella sp.]